ncbi:MAG TPA: tetratricopeptide repeat protein [Thermoanaerobaculia bacterium]|nr:tetratricopeptide repeat protein [Thermoanaerobaculia bacterium]
MERRLGNGVGPCLVALLALPLLSSCAGESARDGGAPDRGGSTAATLLPVPEPDLARSEQGVREQVEEQQRELRTRLDDPAIAPAELASAFGDLGLLYVTYSFLEAAEACFRNAQHLVSEDYRWPYLLGHLYQIQGRLEEATTVLERAIALRPDDRPSHLRLGTVRFEQSDLESARRHFARVLEVDPSSAAAHDGLGKIAAAAGDSAAAVTHFERALALQPSASSVRHALGLAHRRLGHLDQAQKLLEEGGDAPVLFEDPLLEPVSRLARSAELYLVAAADAFSEERYDLAAASYRKALEIDPEDFTARKALGFSLEKLGDVDGAIEQLHLALRHGDSGDEQRTRRERAEVYRILGGLSVLHGGEEEALRYFAKAVELDPERADAHLKLANSLARAGRFDEALAHYDRVLEALPDHSETRVRRATALVNLGRRDEALAEFRRAVEADPENAETRLRYAEALEFLGDLDSARRQRDVGSSLPSGEGERAALLAREAGSLLDRGEIGPALERYRETLRIAPELTDARFEMARILGHLGRYDEALDELARVIAEAPRHGPARRAQVVALLLQERWDEARLRLQQSLEALPRDRQLAHALARVLASAPEERVRNGHLALELASKLHAARPEAATVETLAMALAETGQFDRAAAMQRSLVNGSEGFTDERQRQLQRLDAYERRTAWRASSPDEIIRATLVAESPGRKS